MSGTYSVYKHTNKINGKVYIGITVNEPKVRWGYNGCNYSRQYFGKAINKYGWDNFEHEILFECLSHEEANNKEIELIKLYNSTNKDFGYNIALGGSDVSLLPKSKITYKYSLSGKFLKQYNSLSEAAKDNNSTHAKIGACCRKGINHFSIGFRWSYEYLGEQIAWELMRNNNFYQEVYCYDLDGNFLNKYETVTIAQNDTGINNSAICSCYNGKISNTKGLRWFTEYQGEKIQPMQYDINARGQITISRKQYKINTKPIYQYDSNGMFIKKYNSAKVAADELNVNSLKDACLNSENKGLKSYGYYWSYNYYEEGFLPVKQAKEKVQNEFQTS